MSEDAAPATLEAPAAAAVPVPRSVQRWRDEIVRLREMCTEQQAMRVKLIWVLYVGLVLAVPTVFFHPAAPLGVIAFAVATWGTGRYFAWGHLIERGYQLRMAQKELRKERKAAGLPEQDESVYVAPPP